MSNLESKTMLLVGGSSGVGAPIAKGFRWAWRRSNDRVAQAGEAERRWGQDQQAYVHRRAGHNRRSCR